jgi:signal transduction histidine kinase
MLVFLITDRWSRLGTMLAVAADFLLAVAGVTVTDSSLMWIGLMPVTVTGSYFGWMPGMLMGLAVALAMVLSVIFNGQSAELNLPTLIISLIALPAAGPLVALLASNEAEVAQLRDKLRDRSRRADVVARVAQEYMRVVYQLSEVLSVSRLDPKRVLDSAVGFGLEALDRTGVPPPLFGAILLFAEDESGLGTVLRIARASLSVPPSDSNVAAPGVGGVIERALSSSQPAVARAPNTDPELALFESFRNCQTVVALPMRSGDEAYGVMLVGSGEQDAFKETHIDLMRAVANQAAASLNNVRLYAALLEERDRIVQIEKDARAQLASELHDGPTQGVAAITMRLNYVRKLIEKKPENAVNELYAIEDMARRTTKEIRHMLFELRPKALDQGLYAGLEQLAAKMKETYEQNVRVHMQGPIDQMLDTQTTTTLFSISSECINNARKHAKASQIDVNLRIQDDVFVLEISDDGIGFDVEKALTDARMREGHLGLINLQERAALVDGTLHIDSAPGKGTRTTVVIPIETLRIRKEEEESRTATADQKVVARAATHQ